MMGDPRSPDYGVTQNVPGCRCDLCPLRADRQHSQPIVDEVPAGADILFIGEAPGKNETERGKPMVGASGEELLRYLARARVSRSDVGIANALLCRPPADLDDYLQHIKDTNIERAKANAESAVEQGHPEYLPPINDPRDCCRTRLVRLMVGRRVIIPLGGTAMEAVTGIDKISVWRGSPLRVDAFLAPPERYESSVGDKLPERLPPHPVKEDMRETRAPGEIWVLPTMHPAYALHEGPGRVMRGVIAHDVDKAFRIAREDRIHWTEPNFTLLPRTVDEVVDALGFARDYALKNEVSVAVDIETDPFAHRMECALWMVGVSWGDAGTLTIPFRAVTGVPWWSEADSPAVKAAICDLLMDERIPKVFHNHTFDVPILRRHGYVVNNIEDTMVAHHAVQSELSHSLAFVASLYTDARYWKDAVKEGGKWKPPSDEVFARYCARDCLTTWRIWERSMKLELKGSLPGAPGLDMTEVYRHGMEVAAKVLTPLHLNGMRFDRDKAEEVKKILLGREAECRDRMQVLLAPTDYKPRMLERSKLAKARDTRERYVLEADLFHPGGMWAIRCALEALRIPILERTKTGLLATGQEILAKAAPYATKEGMDFIRLLIGSAEGKAGKIESMGWRACVKLRTTYLEDPEILSDGRVHADWRMLTYTGRFSSSPNCQNQPQFLRSVFVPDPTNVLVSSDFARVEWHAQALLSGDPTLLKLFEEEDPHDVNAKLIFGDRYTSVDKDTKKRLRRLAKCVSGATLVTTSIGLVSVGELCRGLEAGESRVVDEEILVDNGDWMAPLAQVHSCGVQRVVRVSLASGSYVVCTPEHRFETPAAFVPARSLLPGARVRRALQRSQPLLVAHTRGSARSFQRETIEYDEVAAVEPAGAEPVYDLGVEGQRTYVANGVVTHNSFVYGLGYGANDTTIWENLVTEWPELLLKDVRTVSQTMRRLYPKWFKWRDDLLDHVRRQGHLRSPVLGRVRYFLGGIEATEVFNNTAQSTASDAANIAAIRLHDAFVGHPVKIVNQSHDSLTYEAPEALAAWVKEKIEEIMPGPYHVRFNVPGYPNHCDVRFGVDVKIGKNWAEV